MKYKENKIIRNIIIKNIIINIILMVIIYWIIKSDFHIIIEISFVGALFATLLFVAYNLYREVIVLE